MDEREIYGSKMARCPSTGECYHKRALDTLSAAGRGGRRRWPWLGHGMLVSRLCTSAHFFGILHEPLMRHRVHRNLLASPLLRLPPEIRERILRYLLGDQTVHLQFVQRGQGVGVEGGSAGVSDKLRHAICVAKET